MKSTTSFGTPALSAIILAIALGSSVNATAADYTPFKGEKTAWRDGFDRFDYLIDEETIAITPFKRDSDERFGVKPPPKGKRRCIVVVPKTPAPGNPWTWRGCYWDHEPQTEVELLRRGFHVAFITTDPGKTWDAWYNDLTESHGLSKKPSFIGMSRGGINEYDWGTANPDKITCLYADNPAIRPDAFDKLDELARRDIPLLNVCGSLDFLLDRHTLPIESRYRRLGGRITVIIKEGAAHHPHSLRNPKFIADWIENNTKTDRARPDFVDDSFTKSSYYNHAETYMKLEPENTYAVCRGPGFTECHDRYDATTKSQWGVTGMTVIVPKTAAEGKPWVFRADRAEADSAVVDMALLARGYHIVAAPIVAQSGPVREQWDAVYQLMTRHGFSRKPVMEGRGTAAGEVYAWAEDNPDKVSAIYAENPSLHSLMTRTPPIDNLAPLAKAGVLLIHVCGSLDPWLGSQTRVVEKRQRELGGAMNVKIIEGMGHNLSLEKAVVDEIVGQLK